MDNGAKHKMTSRLMVCGCSQFLYACDTLLEQGGIRYSIYLYLFALDLTVEKNNNWSLPRCFCVDAA